MMFIFADYAIAQPPPRHASRDAIISHYAISAIEAADALMAARRIDGH